MEIGLSWTPAIWLALAILLFIAEVLGASGFLIGAAMAAVALSVLTFFIADLGVGMQIGIYAVLAIAGTLIYYRFFRETDPSNADVLPERAQMMVGRRFTLEEKLSAGTELRVQLGDSMWVVTSPADIADGTEVEVIGADAMRLEVATVG